MKNDIRYVRSDIGGFSLPDSLYEGNNKGTFHSGTLYERLLSRNEFGDIGCL